MHLKSPKEIAAIQRSADILSETLGEVSQKIQVGMTTQALDQIAESFILKKGAKPSFKGYEGFPYSLCTSLNHEVVHGMPKDAPLQEGDILSIDCGVLYQGYHADAAFTQIVGDPTKIQKELLGLLRQTHQALELGIAEAHVGNRIGDIGHAIHQHTKQFGYNVVRNYGGHGLGVKLHEPPYISNFGPRGNGPRIQEGMVLAIEPLVNLGTSNVKTAKDGWTVETQDQKASAHFEHTIAIVDGKPKVLTSFKHIKDYTWLASS